MKILRLYIENFMCYDNSIIDFTQFSSALIVGINKDNELQANGVGKTTIFKAIEYGLFNQAAVNLEKIIRDDTNMCRVILDFDISGQEYRLSRSRNRKGSSDLTLYTRTSIEGNFAEIYHQDGKPVFNTQYWKDISGRRASDTEKDLFKLIKYNVKSFRNTIHFVQHDFSGLATATPEKKKLILKEALNLAIYSKLEKIAKDKLSLINKDIEKNKILLDNLGEPSVAITELNRQLYELGLVLDDQAVRQSSLKDLVAINNDKLNELNTSYSVFLSKTQSIIDREKTCLYEKLRVEKSLQEYRSKKSNIIAQAKTLINEVKSLKDQLSKINIVDLSSLNDLNEQIILQKEHIAQYKLIIQNNNETYANLIIPMPNKAFCNHCRQPLTEEHRQECQAKITIELDNCQKNIKSAQQNITIANDKIIELQKEISIIKQSKQKLDDINSLLSIKSKEIDDKSIINDEFMNLIRKYETELKEYEEALLIIRGDMQSASINELNILQKTIESQKQISLKLEYDYNVLDKERTTLENNKAVISHSLIRERQNIQKKTELSNTLVELQEKVKIYAPVLLAFSSTGIPNLIIQNVLDDLQIETNNLLQQLKPGLQLSFIVEKTKGDGSQDDTLDIKYIINGKERDYELLSGAMQLAINFSLKLGLSFLLQKMIGIEIKFLLLDEIDQSLDKASVDAFADIIKMFQKDFTILVITHNDRLKDKFKNTILVEQDINMVSRAKVVEAW